jgi:hypothetical protein
MSTEAAFDNVLEIEKLHGKYERMHKHLEYHRASLCGVDYYADATLRYVSEVYPHGDIFATDCTRTAIASMVFLTGNVDGLYGELNDKNKVLAGLACPEPSTPTVHYINFTGQGNTILDTSTGHRMIIIQVKGGARIMHAFKDQFTLGDYMRKTSAMSIDEFAKWWANLQSILDIGDGAARADEFEKLTKAKLFTDDVTGSWIYSHAIVQ